jgi:hypothetical protein
MTALKLKPKYSIEIQLSGEDMSSWANHAYWLGADTLVAEGDNLEQLIDDATISTTDQEGGEGKLVRLTDLSSKQIQYYTMLMIDRMERQ